MTVVTPDTGSFKKNSDQLLRDLQSKLEGAVKVLGKKNVTDDALRSR